MKTLYLLRHAHAERAAPAPLTDHERILSPEGEAAAEKVARHLEESGAFPTFVLSSTSIRTLQTVRIVCARLLAGEGRRIDSRLDRALYLAPADMLLNSIADVDDTVDSLLVVAHNPGIADLAEALSNGALSDHTRDFPPATLAVFSIDADSWSGIVPGKVKLETVFVP